MILKFLEWNDGKYCVSILKIWNFRIFLFTGFFRFLSNQGNEFYNEKIKGKLIKKVPVTVRIKVSGLMGLLKRYRERRG